MPIINQFRYRPEIDGLRAIAVLSVILFHAGFGFSGGYIGVDIFFVISGFLITSLIWKDLESGLFTFTNFWEKRARRILPALVVVTLATLVAGWLLMTPEDLRSLGGATVLQTVFAANFYYWRNSGYFDGSSDKMPLLHTWSLAVEEQFYFVVPFLLWVIYRAIKLRSRTALISLLGALFAVSFALSVQQVNAHQTSAFYLLPARAWELLCGALVAFLPSSNELLDRQKLREILSLVSLVLILVPVLSYTPNTPFPGFAALPPCLGTALFIWANEPVPTSTGSFLSCRPIVFIGLISYSLYLWHWPFLAFGNYISLGPASAAQRIVMLILGFLFAIISWKYVETPFRKRQIGGSRRSIFAFTGAGLVIVFGCGMLYRAKNGFPQRYSLQAQKYANAVSDMSFINDLTLDDIQSGKLVSLGVANPSLHPTVLVWGDSHAMAALPAIDAFLKEKGLSGRAATHSATAPVLDWSKIDRDGLHEQSLAFNDSVFSYLKNQRIPYVILSGRWSSYARMKKSESISFNSALLTTVRRIVSIGSHPIILLDIPNQNFDVPKALSLPIYSRSYVISSCAKPTAQSKFDMIAPNTISDIEAAGGRFIDPKPSFIDPTGQYYIVQNGDVVLYRDEHHLTTRGARLMLLPLLRNSFLNKVK